MREKLDTIDLRLLKELRRNCKQRISRLSSKLAVPRSTLHNRMKKLERIGVIRRYIAIPNFEKIGLPLTAYVHIVITSRESADEIARRLAAMPNVEEVAIVTGQFDIIAKVRFKNTKELGEFIFGKKRGLRSWNGVERTETMVALSTVKEYGLQSQGE